MAHPPVLRHSTVGFLHHALAIPIVVTVDLHLTRAVDAPASRTPAAHSRCRSAYASTPSFHIGPDYLHAGLAIVHYAIDSARHIFGDLIDHGYIHTHKHQPERGRPTTIFSWSDQPPPDPIGELLNHPNVEPGRD